MDSVLLPTLIAMVDETRAQAYTNLIQQLLSCPNSEEPQILQANSELVNLGFLQVSEGVATILGTKIRIFYLCFLLL